MSKPKYDYLVVEVERTETASFCLKVPAGWEPRSPEQIMLVERATRECYDLEWDKSPDGPQYRDSYKVKRDEALYDGVCSHIVDLPAPIVPLAPADAPWILPKK